MPNGKLRKRRDRLEVVGLMKNHNFHAARSIAEGMRQKFPRSFFDPKIVPLFECDWNVYLWEKKRELGGEVWQYPTEVMCFLNDQLLGDDSDLARWAEEEWQFTVTHSQSDYQAFATHYIAKHIKNSGHQFVFMDIEIQGEPAGKLVFELFSDLCPKTSQNFKTLCTGQRGQSESGLKLCFRDSIFHRVVPSGWVQGGDISPGRKGNGGESIFGPTFEDESFAISHTKRGILGMANQGPHTNASQFYITLQPTVWMDRTYVAFGQVVEGDEVLRRLEEIPTCNERPKLECRIAQCGKYESTLPNVPKE